MVVNTFFLLNGLILKTMHLCFELGFIIIFIIITIIISIIINNIIIIIIDCSPT